MLTVQSINSTIVFLVLSLPLFSQSELNTTLISAWKDSTDLNLGYNDVWGYADEIAGEYAIIGSRSHVNFVNITNPSTPYVVSRHKGANTTTWRDMKTYEHYAYSVCDGCQEGMHIFDLSTLPDTATHIKTDTTYFKNSHNIFIEGSRLYAVGMAGNTDLIIFDLAQNPASPAPLAIIDLDDIVGSGADKMYIHDIYVDGNIAYASHGYEGYFIWDVTDPNNVLKIADNDWGGYNHSSWISECGQFAYVAEEVPKGLPAQVVALEDMMSGNIPSVGTFIDNIGTVGSNGLNVTHHNPFVHRDMLYISNYEDGVKIYDVRNPENPVLYGYYDSYLDDNMAETYNGYNGVWGTYPYLPSGLLLASDRKYGLQVIQVKPFDCAGTAMVIGVETMSENEKYSCCIVTGANSRIENNVNSKYTAQNYVHFGNNFEVELGSQVLFSIEVCEN